MTLQCTGVCPSMVTHRNVPINKCTSPTQLVLSTCTCTCTTSDMPCTVHCTNDILRPISQMLATNSTVTTGTLCINSGTNLHYNLRALCHYVVITYLWTVTWCTLQAHIALLTQATALTSTCIYTYHGGMQHTDQSGCCWKASKIIIFVHVLCITAAIKIKFTWSTVHAYTLQQFGRKNKSNYV